MFGPAGRWNNNEGSTNVSESDSEDEVRYLHAPVSSIVIYCVPEVMRDHHGRVESNGP